MLCHRVIPIVLLDGYSVLKTIEFDVRRNLGNPITIARIYNARNVDELVLLDIDASKENRCIDLHSITEVAKECFMPLTVGGGIRSCHDVSEVLKAGADKVSINSGFLLELEFIKEAVGVFGSQCIVVSLDVKRKHHEQFELFSHAGIECTMSLQDAIRRVEDSGAGEILLNNVDLDGKMTGYDLEVIELVCSQINIPVIAAGGAGKPQDFADAVNAGASAASGASIFHFTSFTPNDCKGQMAEGGIAVRSV